MTPLAMSSTLRIAVITLSFVPLTLARDCFLMNGLNVTDTHAPCKDDLSPTEHSSCCSIKKDVCMSSGLCLSNNGLYRETGCTNPTWESDACVNLCPDQRGNWQGSATGDWSSGEKHDYWQVLACGPDKACCRTRDGNPNCCGHDRPYDVSFKIGTPVMSATTTTVMATDSDGGGVTCPPTSTGASQDGESVGSEADETCQECNETTIGAAVGASLGAALVAALGGIWFLLHRQKQLNGTIGQHQAAQSQYQDPTKYGGPPVEAINVQAASCGNGHGQGV